MNHSRLQHLFERYFDKTASPQERTELAGLLSDDGNRDQVMQLFTAAWESYQGEENIITEERREEMLEQILGKHEAPVKRTGWWRYAAAAAVLVFVIGGYFLLNNKKNSSDTVIAKVEDVQPGAFKARLTLADGSTITLDSAALGELAKQGNTLVINKDGQLVYNSSATSGEVLYNTVSTAKGETYTMTLADGSKVWLNSGSSIHFPVAFPGKERRIEITGEVYVKVARNPAQPFIASANGMDVLALGTEFNINSYPDEDNISTTLIEGSVKVSKGASTTTLKPGQQTLMNSSGQLSTSTNVNIDEIVAWKDGWFHFENADLKTILRQFSRWYDVEIIYEGPVKDRKFLAIVKRSSTLKQVLEMLQLNDIHYRIEGKKLIIKQG